MFPPLPRRTVHSLRTALAALFVLGVSSLGLAGCPGDLDPRLLGGGGPQFCDAVPMIETKCGQAGCHGATAPQVGLDLLTDGIPGRLLGQPSNTALNAVCSTNTKPYLETGSNPATGFFLDKLIEPVPCGTVMPQIPGPLNANEMACMLDWATGVTTGQIQ